MNITGSGQPVLKLEDRRGENACMSRAEDVHDMYTYVAGIVKVEGKGFNYGFWKKKGCKKLRR